MLRTLTRQRRDDASHGHRVILVDLAAVNHANACRADFDGQVQQFLA